jgi:hypothetical protein
MPPRVCTGCRHIYDDSRTACPRCGAGGPSPARPVAPARPTPTARATPTARVVPTARPVPPARSGAAVPPPASPAAGGGRALARWSNARMTRALVRGGGAPAGRALPFGTPGAGPGGRGIGGTVTGGPRSELASPRRPALQALRTAAPLLVLAYLAYFAWSVVTGGPVLAALTGLVFLLAAPFVMLAIISHFLPGGAILSGLVMRSAHSVRRLVAGLVRSAARPAMAAGPRAVDTAVFVLTDAAGARHDCVLVGPASSAAVRTGDVVQLVGRRRRDGRFHVRRGENRTSGSVLQARNSPGAAEYAARAVWVVVALTLLGQLPV